MLRYQPPVHSPLPWRAVTAGVTALFGSGDAGERAVLDALRGRFGSAALLRTDSGTSALTLALAAVARERPGRPIALPAYCCYDIATAADGARVPVLLYDVDPATLGPAPDSLRRMLEAGAGGVVIAHLYGVPVDVDPVLELAQEYDTIVIDDAAQGAGASYDGRPLGAFGSLGVLSFGRGKGITGCGGGALVGNDSWGSAALAASGGGLTAGGRGARAVIAGAAQWLLARPALYGIPSSLPFLHLGETIYRSPAPPAAPAAACSAMLAATWPLAAAESDVRRRNAGRLLGSLDGEKRAWTIRIPDRSIAGYLRLPLVASAATRAAVAEARRFGVMPGYPRSLIDLKGFGGRSGLPRESYVGARTLAEGLITLPTHGVLREDDLRRLESWLASAPE